jgi:hypothetical protein
LNRILVPLEGTAARRGLIPALRRLAGGTGVLVHLWAVRPEIRHPERSGDCLLYLDELRLQERAHWLGHLARQGSHLAYHGIVVPRGVRFADALTERPLLRVPAPALLRPHRRRFIGFL